MEEGVSKRESLTWAKRDGNMRGGKEGERGEGLGKRGERGDGLTL